MLKFLLTKPLKKQIQQVMRTCICVGRRRCIVPFRKEHFRKSKRRYDGEKEDNEVEWGSNGRNKGKERLLFSIRKMYECEEHCRIQGS